LVHGGCGHTSPRSGGGSTRAAAAR
jgi:hypothetical protein